MWHCRQIWTRLKIKQEANRKKPHNETISVQYFWPCSMVHLYWILPLSLCQQCHSQNLSDEARISDAHSGAKRSRARCEKENNKHSEQNLKRKQTTSASPLSKTHLGSSSKQYCTPWPWCISQSTINTLKTKSEVNTYSCGFVDR